MPEELTRKQLEELYLPPAGEFVEVDVPDLPFFMLDGEGAEDRAPLERAVRWLFTAIHPLKQEARERMGKRFVEPPLEGLWWADDLSVFTSGARDGWLWTMMIMQPEYVTEELVQAATEEVRRRKNLPALPRVRFEAFREGEAAQILHVGPFTDEGPTIGGLHAFIDESGRKLGGKHHEIYLSDIRRAAPERWKTIIRQPIA